MRGGCHAIVVEPQAARQGTLPAYIDEQRRSLGLGLESGTLECKNSLEDVDWHEVEAVIECILEDLEAKRALFVQLERLADPETILASNSSSFPISQIACGLSTAHRVLNLHFFMPAHLVLGVEVVRSQQTESRYARRLSALMTQCGMVPVEVARDLPGFLASRLQHALARDDDRCRAGDRRGRR